jgi:hypothetical protein
MNESKDQGTFLSVERENMGRIRNLIYKDSEFLTRPTFTGGPFQLEKFKMHFPSAHARIFEDRKHINQEEFPELVEDILNIK